MRDKLACDASQQIAVMKIMKGINFNIDDIEALKVVDAQTHIRVMDTIQKTAVNTSKIAALESQTPINPGDIPALEARVSGLENEMNATEMATAANEGNISTNTMNVNSLNARVMAAETKVEAVIIDVEATDNMVMALQGKDMSIDAEIVTIKGRLDAVEAALGTSTASLLMEHKVAGGTGGGSAVDMTWTARPLGVAIVNTMGATVGPTSVTIAAGTYSVHMIAMAEGVHQSRLNFGGGMLLGTTCSTSGSSEAQGVFTIAASTNISVETIVEAATGTDTLGKASPFNEESVFLTLEIIKVG